MCGMQDSRMCWFNPTLVLPLVLSWRMVWPPISMQAKLG
ncbi:hypothetical protein LINPERPRIM_LOCUS32342 [Linum perenne]